MDEKTWLDQLEFNKILFRDYGLDVESLSLSEKVHWVKEFYFHINKELSDLIECIPQWKMHYRNDERENEIVTSNLLEEYVDVFKYLMGLGQVLGLKHKDIIEAYKNKTQVVYQKYEQNKKIDELRKKEVILFDIDGVINTYPQCFLEWLEKNKNVVFKSIEEMKSFLTLKQYEEFKTEYRLSGAKRNQPVDKETVELMRKLKQQNETIILFTNRPVSKYRIIYSDTLSWLKSNDIPFDAIYWSDYNQKEDIYKLKFKIKYIVEDNLDNAKNFVHENHYVFLIQKPYNQDDIFKHQKLIRINNPLEILSYELCKNVET